MNREIKFRAWLEGKHDNMIISKPTMEYNVIVGEKGGYLSIEGGWDIHGEYCTVPIMQYTGLKDKNGKEIYEGDILISSFGEGKPIKLCFGEFKDATDSYEDSCTRVGFYWHESDGILSSFGKSINGDMNYCEVVGNIYENPELL